MGGREDVSVPRWTPVFRAPLVRERSWERRPFHEWHMVWERERVVLASGFTPDHVCPHPAACIRCCIDQASVVQRP